MQAVPVNKEITGAAYRATFVKHRVLYCLPPIIIAIIAVVVVASKKATYESSATILVENAPPLGSSLNVSSSAGSPAAIVRTVLGELLTTQRFADSVAQKSQLKRYIVTHPDKGGWIPLISSSKKSYAAQVAAMVGPNVSVNVPGPQFLSVSYRGPTAAVTQSVLSALIKELESASIAYSSVYSNAELTYYRAEASTARRSLMTARAEATAYLQSHPKATEATSPTYATILNSIQSAGAQLAQANGGAVTASSAVKTNANAPIMKLYDPPGLATASSTGKKKVLEALIGGLVAGAVISLLVVVLRTPGRFTTTDGESDGLQGVSPLVLPESARRGIARGDETLDLTREEEFKAAPPG